MKKLFYLLCFLLFTYSVSVYAKKTIKINFTPRSSGDYELYLKKAFERIGYNVIINYHDRIDSSIKYDYELNYKDSAWFYGDDLRKIELKLYNPQGDLLHSVISSTSYVNFGINPVKVVFKAVYDLTGIRIPYIKKEDDIPKLGGKTWNISFYVEKLDSTIYVIRAKGAAIRTKDEMEEAFLKKANILLDTFSYYYKIEDYYYNSSGPVIISNVNVNMSFVNKAIMITGIIKEEKERYKLNSIPPIFENYYTDKIKYKSGISK